MALTDGEQLVRGKHCYIKPHPLDENMLLKVFDFKEFDPDDVDAFEWGDPPNGDNPRMNVKLTDATLIQNLCWLHGLAPRVWGIVKEGKYLAQEVEKLEGGVDIKEAYKVYNKVKELGKVYGFGNEKDDVSDRDVIDGKLVDFNTFHFKDRDKLKEEYIKHARYGKIYYHNVPEWGLNNAPRDNEARERYMKLHEIEFADRSVLDLGCAGGYFCRYAMDRMAREVVGIDYPDVVGSDPIKGANIVSFALGYNDIRFIDADLLKYKPLNDSDIVFFLSMNFHISIPEWLASVTNEVCIFEDNSKERNAKKQLEKMFREVKWVGTAKDHGNKSCYHCFK